MFLREIHITFYLKNKSNVHKITTCLTAYCLRYSGKHEFSESNFLSSRVLYIVYTFNVQAGDIQIKNTKFQLYEFSYQNVNISKLCVMR